MKEKFVINNINRLPYIIMQKDFLKIFVVCAISIGLFWNTVFALEKVKNSRAPVLQSSWIDKSRIMVIYNTKRMISVDPAELDSFSHDIGAWYMTRYGMPTTHLFGYNLGTSAKMDYNGLFDFLKAVANYITVNKIQIVLMAPGTPVITAINNGSVNLAIDSLVGHALWFAHVIKEVPTVTGGVSVQPETSNLYFPYMDMKDGASPFVVRTSDVTPWVSTGDKFKNGQWYDTMMMDLRDHPSVRPFGRIGLPYYLEAYLEEGQTIADIPSELQIPLENSQFVKDLVNGGIAATTSIEEFNAQSARSLLFFGREGNTASFIDVEAGMNEAMAKDAIMQGISPSRIKRVASLSAWDTSVCLPEPVWNYTGIKFLTGEISSPINAFIFSGGGIDNWVEGVDRSGVKYYWPKSLDVKPGMVASDPVSNGKTFAGSLLKRGATTVVLSIQHPSDARLYAWFSVYRQLIGGATVTEAMVTSGGSERGGYISGSVWGDPLYAPFGHNSVKSNWFTGGLTSGNINTEDEEIIIDSSTPVNIYPQPFKTSSGHTTIYFTKLTDHTRLQIFNVAGELVYDGEKDTLNGQIEWNTLNSRGEQVASGIYFYVISDENNNIRKGKLAKLR